MAKVIYHGPAGPDHEVYKSGPVIGGKRFYGPSKTGKDERIVPHVDVLPSEQKEAQRLAREWKPKK